MKNKQSTVKYNAVEVRITRCVAALFLFGLIALSLWGVRRLYRYADFLIYISSALFAVAAVVTGILSHRQKKAGVALEQKVWGMDFWYYIALSGAIAHVLLAVTRPVEFWVYTAPMAYLLLVLHYLLYVAALDQGKSFGVFGFLCAAAGLGAMGMYQTYYNPKQLTISTRIFSHADAYTVGWIVLAAAAVLIVYIARRQKASFWKQLSVAVLFAAYWGALQLGLGGQITTWIFAGVLAVWFVLLRVLRQIKVIG